METKKCFKCGKEQGVSEFYKHSKMADGRLGKCKTCTKKDVDENRKKNIDYYREYDRKRGNRQPRSHERKWRKENPEKYCAHYLLSNAVRDGRIKKGPCERCESTNRVHGHHDDYAKPLEVRWLCCPCHHREHPKNEN